SVPIATWAVWRCSALSESSCLQSAAFGPGMLHVFEPPAFSSFATTLSAASEVSFDQMVNAVPVSSSPTPTTPPAVIAMVLQGPFDPSGGGGGAAGTCG